MTEFTHLDDEGNAVMVDVSAKENTKRFATAKGAVLMAPKTLELIKDGRLKKGDVLSVAQLAGIMAAKKTSELVPLCHPLGLSSVKVDLNCDLKTSSVNITATCKLTGKTGVEMEALTAVTVSALTVYDMCKSVDRSMQLSDIRLVHKSGGKSGVFKSD